MIYRPAETALLKAAKAAGCRTANGLGMLLYQGAKALELWTGQPAPVEIMRQALENERLWLNNRACSPRPLTHAIWAAVPFHFWSLVFFVFGSIVGSFLNVCIHRMPLGQSIVSPPSHCPHCKYSIPWYLNIPLVTWLYLRGKCRNCGAPISIRYFLVELLTAVTFLAAGWRSGASPPGSRWSMPCSWPA